MALSKKRAASVALHSIGGCSASEKLRLGADGNVHARWHAFKILAAILCVAGLAWLGMAYLIPAPPSQITIATSPTGEHYHVLGTRYQGIQAGSEVKVELRLTDGAKENLRLLNDPNSGIQIGFMQGGISNGRLAPDLVSLGRIDHQIFFALLSNW